MSCEANPQQCGGGTCSECRYASALRHCNEMNKQVAKMFVENAKLRAIIVRHRDRLLNLIDPRGDLSGVSEDKPLLMAQLSIVTLILAELDEDEGQ